MRLGKNDAIDNTDWIIDDQSFRIFGGLHVSYLD